MIRGIEFLLPDGHDRHLYHILKSINLENKVCYIEFNEVYFKSKDRHFEDFFIKNAYNGQELTAHIHAHEHFIIFFEVFIYPEKGIYEQIESYNDFIESDCEMILLISDSVYCEVYHKSEVILQRLFKIFEKLGYEGIIYKDENDSRYRMSVT
ncbi:DUF2691 family protein [Fusibacter ferrireducens]|uniref:DUF2691 family protein n=1 Tax=Fusibacter ferrireducens TaxID=2785058 RepID=A0ABS0A010_9FIRM|nr:DUF2691 family protein [Fusibacter ferrireducens]MBF4696041.1 DUF2691 family protein [Fusibacter ferrireducens]